MPILTLIGMGFFDIFRFGRQMLPPPIISVVCGPVATKFFTAINNQSITSNIEKITKNNDVITVKNLAEKTVKSVDAASSFFI